MTLPPSLQDIASCVSGYDPKALPVAGAQDFIARLVPRVQGIEMLAIRSSLGRVLARDIVSSFNVPAHDNSAMDGYALRGADLTLAAQSGLQIAGTGLAGQPHGLLQRCFSTGQEIRRHQNPIIVRLLVHHPFSCSRIARVVLSTVSGLSEMLSMPCSTRN